MAKEANKAAGAGTGKPEKYFLEPSPANAMVLNLAKRNTPKQAYTHAIGAPQMGCWCNTKKYISIAGAVQKEIASAKESISTPKLLSVPNRRATRPSNISNTAANKINQPACAKCPLAAAKMEKNPQAKLPRVNKEGAVMAPVCFSLSTTFISAFCEDFVSSCMMGNPR